MEIKVEFHEGAILLSTLLAVCWDHFFCSPLSVWCGFLSSSYAQLFLFLKKIILGRKLCVGGYTTLTQVRKIDSAYLEMEQMELVLCPVLGVIGICASESKFSLHSLFPIVFIGVTQWSLRYGHGLCGIGTGDWPLFFQSFTPFCALQVSSSWSEGLIQSPVSGISMLILDGWFTVY